MKLITNEKNSQTCHTTKNLRLCSGSQLTGEKWFHKQFLSGQAQHTTDDFSNFSPTVYFALIFHYRNFRWNRNKRQVISVNRTVLFIVSPGKGFLFSYLWWSIRFIDSVMELYVEQYVLLYTEKYSKSLLCLRHRKTVIFQLNYPSGK